MPFSQLWDAISMIFPVGYQGLLPLQVVSWNSAQGWIACGGESGLLKAQNAGPRKWADRSSWIDSTEPDNHHFYWENSL